MIKTDQNIQRNKQYTKGNSGSLTNEYKMVAEIMYEKKWKWEFFLKVIWGWFFIIILLRNHYHRRQNDINLVP